MALLQIRSTLFSHDLPSLATHLFKRLTRSILPKFNRQSVLYDIGKSNLITFLETALSKPRYRYSENILFIPEGSTAVVQRETWTMDA